MLRVKFIIFFILIGAIGKANVPVNRYYENNNKLQTSISKVNTNDNNIVDFVFEESTIEEQEEEENENTNESSTNFALTNSSSFLCFTTNYSFVSKKIPYNGFSKKQFTTNKLYISFSNFRI